MRRPKRGSLSRPPRRSRLNCVMGRIRPCHLLWIGRRRSRRVLARARLVPVALGLSASGGVGYAHPRLRGAFLYPHNLAPDHLQGVGFAENAAGGVKNRDFFVRDAGRKNAEPPSRQDRQQTYNCTATKNAKEAKNAKRGGRLEVGNGNDDSPQRGLSPQRETRVQTEGTTTEPPSRQGRQQTHNCTATKNAKEAKNAKRGERSRIGEWRMANGERRMVRGFCRLAPIGARRKASGTRQRRDGRRAGRGGLGKQFVAGWC